MSTLELTVADFAPGDKVKYVPYHAHGNIAHPDCEHGIVTSTNEEFVFARYYRNGILQHTAESTYPRDLIKT